MIKVQVSDSDNNNVKTYPKVQKPKSKAYGFFSSLSHVFTDNKLVESFAWGKPDGGKTGGGKGDPVTSNTATKSLERNKEANITTGPEPTETTGETLELNDNKTITGSNTVTSGEDELMEFDLNCSGATKITVTPSLSVIL